MTPGNAAKADALIDEGRTHLHAGRRSHAEVCFRRAARICQTPQALNNWALCRHLEGDHADALRILTPLLGGPIPAPFSRALASLSLSAQGESDAAHEQLRLAVRDFDAGLRGASLPGGVFEPAWVEYGILVKQAACALGDFRLVLDLHGRWPGRDLPHGAFLAGVAAFNLRRFAQAAKTWRRITHPDWDRLAAGHASVADLAERGLVPPFQLEHDLGPDWSGGELDAETARGLMASGSVRARYLAALFEGKAGNPAALIDALIAATGDWGVDLGHRLLAGATVPMPFKLGAAKALTEAGVFALGQEISVVQDGRPTSIRLERREVRDEDPELDRVVAEALRLRDAGRQDEAYRLLANLQAAGTMYPPAMATLANLMRGRGELDEAQALFEALDQLAPDNPSVLLNLAGLWLQKGDRERALAYAERIDPAGMPPEFCKRLAGLKQHLAASGLLARLPDINAIADEMRAEAEEKPISPTVSLAAALKQTPVQWLNAAAALHKLPPARRRTERERSLAAALREPERLRAVLAAEGPQVRSALRYLLESGGWAKLQMITRRFGALDGDGFWWDEQPPTFPLGRLRVLGLVFVGRERVDGRAYKLAVVPPELRPLLSGVL